MQFFRKSISFFYALLYIATYCSSKYMNFQNCVHIIWFLVMFYTYIHIFERFTYIRICAEIYEHNFYTTVKYAIYIQAKFIIKLYGISFEILRTQNWCTVHLFYLLSTRTIYSFKFTAGCFAIVGKSFTRHHVMLVVG